MSKNKFIGKWRITEMEQWDQNFIDAEVRGYITFSKNGMGEFQFGYVQRALAQPTGVPRRFFRMLVLNRILQNFYMLWLVPARRVKHGVRRSKKMIFRIGY